MAGADGAVSASIGLEASHALAPPLASPLWAGPGPLPEARQSQLAATQHLLQGGSGPQAPDQAPTSTS